jgi:hypothetical protein
MPCTSNASYFTFLPVFGLQTSFQYKPLTGGDRLCGKTLMAAKCVLLLFLLLDSLVICCQNQQKREGGQHKVRIYKEYHSVCPLVGIGMTPLSQASVPSLPPDQRVGGTLPAAKRVGESPFRRLEKKLSNLPTL